MIILVVWALMGVIGGLIAQSKGRTGSGVILGILLGPIGWLIVLAMADERMKCHACMMPVDPVAIICPHCRSSLIPVRNQPPIQQPAPSPAPEETVPAKLFYYSDQQFLGPFTLSDLREKYKSKEIPSTTLVRVDGIKELVPLHTLLSWE